MEENKHATDVHFHVMGWNNLIDNPLMFNMISIHFANMYK